MKKIINSLLPVLLAVVVFYGCNDDVEYNDTNTTPVSELLIPDDNLVLELINNANATQFFSWNPPTTTTAYNYGLAFYASESGAEIYRMEADDSGSRPYATIKHDDLIQVAKLAGIGPEETGDIYWNVISMRGGNESQPTAARRKITLTRYAAFDDIPYSLYVVGEASEAGSDYSNSPKFKLIDDGIFEIYTQLEGGKEYQLTNRPDSGVKRSFTYEDGALREEDAMMIAPDGIFRITVNFNTARVTMENIAYVAYYYPNDDSRLMMDYVGEGHWQTNRFTLNFSDDRYHFRAMVDGVEEAWGHQDRDTQSVPDQLSGSYFDIYPTEPEASDRWKRSFKFNSLLNGIDIVLNVYMSSDISNYTHTIDAGDIDPIPVSQVNTPSDSYTIDLSGMGTGTLTFDWNAVSNPNGPDPTYEVVFFADADLTNEVDAYSTGTSTNRAFSRTELQTVGARAAEEGQDEVTIYWTVRSTIMGSTALASTGARSLTIKLLTIPSEIYISGSDTEFSGFRALRPMGSGGEGLFEIYTQLSGSDYMFTTGTTGSYRTFYIDGSMDLVENVGSSTHVNGIYRINLDFVNETATMENITNVRFEVPANYQTFNLAYSGDGVWEAFNEVIDWTANDWSWGDDRFLFWVDTDGTEVKYASNQSDFNNGGDYNVLEPEGQDMNYYVYPTDNTDRYEYAWKFWYGSGYRTTTGKRITVKLNMSPDPTYYYVYLQYPDAV